MANFLQELSKAVMDDGTVNHSRGKPLTIERNNNSGALEDGPFARAQPGYQPGGGRFAKFATPEDGNRAQETLLREGKRYRGKSIVGILASYTPATAENPTDARRNYIGYIAARAGIDADVAVPPDKIPLVAAAMREFETGHRQNIRFSPYGGNASGGGGGGGGSTQVASRVAPAVDISSIRPTSQETATMSQTRETVADPFNATAQLREQHQEGTRRLSAADVILQQTIEQAAPIREEMVRNVEGAVEVKQRINQVNRESTEQLVEHVKPIWDQNIQLAERRRELAGMNPLKQAVASIFDPNYNDSYLRAMGRGNEAALAAYGERYDGMFKAQQTLANLAAMDANDQNSILELQLANMGEDVQLAMQSYNLGMASLDTSLKAFSADNAVIQAQETLRVDTLNGMTPGMLNVALEEAQANGGVAMVQGIPIRQPEITERLNGLADRALAMESRQLAIEAQRMGMADQFSDKIMESMTEAELRTAIGAGGMFEGQQFDVVKLGERLGNVSASKDAAAQSGMQEQAGDQAVSVIQTLRGQMTNSTTRARGLTGQVPEALTNFQVGATAALTRFTEGLREAKAAGLGSEYIQQNLPGLIALQESQQKAIDSVADQWSGGNKSLKSLATAWMNGTPLNAESAIDGLIYVAENGLPSGMRFDGPAGSVYRVVREEVARSQAGSGGQSITAALQSGGESAAAKAADLKNRIRRRVQGTYGSQVLNDLLDSAPEVARQVQVNGNPHPFSRISKEDMQNAIRMGDQAGFKTVAGAMGGLDAGVVAAAFAGGESSTAWKNLSGSLPAGKQDFAHWEGVLAASQSQSMMQFLDSSSSGRAMHRREGGVRPSQALRDLLNNPQFQRTAGNYGKAASYGTLGGFLVSQIGGINVSDTVQGYTENYNRAYAGRVEQRTANAAEQSESLASDPWERTRFMLGAVDGLSTQDEQRLFDAVKQQTQPKNPLVRGVAAVGSFLEGMPTSMAIESPMDQNQSQTIDSFIINGRFEDPQLEALRKRAAKSWTTITQTTGRAVDRYYRESN